MSQDQANNDKLKSKIKQTWGRLGEEDIALYTSGKQEQFFDVLEEKHGVARRDAEDRLDEIRESCGGVSGASKAA